jgi:hypothetical protein
MSMYGQTIGVRIGLRFEDRISEFVVSNAIIALAYREVSITYHQRSVSEVSRYGEGVKHMIPHLESSHPCGK